MDPLPTGVHRFLISTTSRFTGAYESPALRIDHARPSADSYHSIRQGLEEGPYSRNYFALSVNIGEPERKTILIPNYRGVGDQVCVVLSILFGKRFDNHGLLVSHGMFHVPEFNLGLPTNYFTAAPYSHQPRRDVGVQLELQRFATVAPLFTDENREDKFIKILFAAGRFYLRSLQIFDREPEFAYLDLITCGEALANYYKYPLDQLLDEDTKNSLERIRADIQGGAQIVNQLRGKFRQIKRAYTRTLMHLLTSTFFMGSECAEEAGRLRMDDIEKRLKASYDLRSYYLHTGTDFGRWMRPHGALLNEVQLGRPGIKDRKLANAISLAPTYFGMERIMRYCLLRFIHMKGVPIDPVLNGAPLNVEETEPAVVSSEASRNDPKKPTFELQQVFPPGDNRRVLQIRFLMASQALVAIFRVGQLLPPTPATAESKGYLMMLSIGAANEAASAFLEADRSGALDELLRSGLNEMEEAVARLRQECDEHAKGSLRKQILLVLRNTMGFHWDAKIVKRSLERLREADVALWAAGESENVADTAFPLVSAIIDDSLNAAIGGTEEGVEAMMSRIVSMQADCYNLAHALYAVALKNAGVE